ncbi:MAG: isoprenylcysteine carboxylmethyltransferase family protein [Hyphomicrobiales bacterium]|nr:MAG: isoprenylcysteine carboxylmethyltransferase family protein [Hyphomicrobiales bacterium]
MESDWSIQEWMELWPYALLIVTLMSWGLYHFLAPAGWRERTGAGVVQAFIIALYAEMYGFPLTLYLLSSFLPQKLPLTHSSGHLWSALLGAGEIGSVIETLIGYSILMAGALLIVKGWVRIHFAGDHLVNSGPYSLIRHPQYAGIFLVVAGEIIDWPTALTIILAPIVFGMYIRLAQREESSLVAEFGMEYRTYQQRVPMFIPTWRKLLS